MCYSKEETDNNSTEVEGMALSRSQSSKYFIGNCSVPDIREMMNKINF